jgi:hypothetical protein
VVVEEAKSRMYASPHSRVELRALSLNLQPIKTIQWEAIVETSEILNRTLRWVLFLSRHDMLVGYYVGHGCWEHTT